jgi:hypothetical protein
MIEIATKEQLVGALKDGAEIEHQLMCQYLYAAFSMKKDRDQHCTGAQLERVRHWRYRGQVAVLHNRSAHGPGPGGHRPRSPRDPGG